MSAAKSVAAAPARPVTAASVWTAALPAIPALAAIVWAYADVLRQLAHQWWTEPDYNHGFVVPIFSAYLLWFRRNLINPRTMKGNWWGLALLLAAAGMRLVSVLFFYPNIDVPSLLPCLAGLTLLLGGWSALRWAWPSIVFLVFMMPLPGSIAGLFSHKLQRLATIGSTWVLQLVGVPAFSEGNVIRLTQGEIGVVEACSGLRMLMLFLAITVGASFLLSQPFWERALVAASALGIGIIANIVRIAVTAILFEYVDQDWAHAVFHDLAGWFMMPLAIFLLLAELRVLSWLFIPPDEFRPLVLGDHRPLRR